MPTCNGCGKENPGDAAYCVHCGAELTVLVGDAAAAGEATAEATAATGTGAVLEEKLRAATLGEYEILGELGRGGMAVVYLAHDLALDRRVAIKVISPSVLWLGQGVPERFKREARTAASLSHPNIIPIYAVKERDDLLFFVMKYVKGRPLDSVIGEVGPLPVAMVHTILGQVGTALGYAHRQGVVHRDVKPGNVMLDEEGWAVVTDFGIAKVAEAEGLTQTGGTVGTPSYMSPEQCSGLPVTGASDQYSLGIVAYEMLTGKKPFEAKSAMALMYKHCNTPPPPLAGVVPDCPSFFANAVMRMLEKAPKDRWPNLEEMVATLGSVPPAESDRVRTQMLTLAKSTEAQALVEKFQTPASPVPRDRLSDSIALATKSRAAREAGAVTPPDVTPIPSVQPSGKKRLVWAIPPALGAALVLFLWAPWQGSDGRPATGAPPVEAAPPPVALATPEPAIPVSVEVTPPVTSLTIGDTIRLAAAVFDGRGNALGDPDLMWESGDMSVARVSSRGLVSAIATGEAEIRAHVGDVTASAFITVNPPRATRAQSTPPAPRVTSVRVNPPAATLAVGETAQLSAVVRDQNGNTMNRAVTWSSSDNGVAVVTADGMVVARGHGAARITAQGSGRSGSAVVTVAPPAAGTVAVSPTRSSIQVGGTVQLRSTARDASGNQMDEPVTWSSNDGSVARVSPSGLVTGVAPGTAVVTAQSGTAQATAQIMVEAPAPAPMPVAPADPAPEIRSVLQAYGQALQAGDLTALRRVWPGIADRRAQDLQTFFANTGDRRVTVTVNDIVPSGDAARAEITTRYQLNSGRQDHTERSSVTLVRGAQGWYITDVR